VAVQSPETTQGRDARSTVAEMEARRQPGAPALIRMSHVDVGFRKSPLRRAMSVYESEANLAEWSVDFRK
jgi:hypothetical protein